jgi:hypothetical protein
VVVDHQKLKSSGRPSNWHQKMKKVAVDHQKLESGGRPSEDEKWWSTIRS